MDMNSQWEYWYNEMRCILEKSCLYLLLPIPSTSFRLTVVGGSCPESLSKAALPSWVYLSLLGTWPIRSIQQDSGLSPWSASFTWLPRQPGFPPSFLLTPQSYYWFFSSLHPLTVWGPQSSFLGPRLCLWLTPLMISASFMSLNTTNNSQITIFGPDLFPNSRFLYQTDQQHLRCVTGMEDSICLNPLVFLPKLSPLLVFSIQLMTFHPASCSGPISIIHSSFFHAPYAVYQEILLAPPWKYIHIGHCLPPPPLWPWSGALSSVTWTTAIISLSHKILCFCPCLTKVYSQQSSQSGPFKT